MLPAARAVLGVHLGLEITVLVVGHVGFVEVEVCWTRKSRPAWCEHTELLKHADMSEILKDFGKREGKEDPVVHFYASVAWVLLAGIQDV